MAEAEAASTRDADLVKNVEDDGAYYWNEATSRDGKKYRIGVLKSDHPDRSEAEVKALFGSNTPEKAGSLAVESTEHVERANYDIDVSWPYPSSGPTSREVSDKIKIGYYKLSWNTGGYYDYCLAVTISEGGWAYQFDDETNDSYSLWAKTDGRHTVCYDSKKPSIVKVHGRRPE